MTQKQDNGNHAATPGPWHRAPLGSFRIYGPANMGRQSGPIAEALGVSSPHIQRANARLIAATPSLLSALTALLDDVEEYGLKHPEADSRFEPESAEEARAAIAKAKGD